MRGESDVDLITELEAHGSDLSLRAAAELRRWVYGGGKVLPGLVARREAEVMLVAADLTRQS